ncbi:MAG TPA: sigma-54 dependent transcriptional regulator [Clostridiaceae bacterium]
MAKILVIDDEQYMGWIIKKAFSKSDAEIVTALTGTEGIKLIDTEYPDLIMLDLRLPDYDGMDILKEIKGNGLDIPVIIITAHGSIDTAIASMKAGAFDYITKPFDVDELLFTAEKAIEMGRLKNEVNFLRSQALTAGARTNVESKSIIMREIYDILPQIASSQATVLINGESGTGKEVIGREIHKLSSRKDNPFIAINCSALPENLLERELFGYEKGAFAGAIQRKPGRLELAKDGTIFLDGIGEISMNMQVKLLRVLEEKEFQRLGGNSTIKVNFRIIAATNINLAKAISDGTFREDLYYRLNVISLELPPLRKRKEDIKALTNEFIKTFDLHGRIVGISKEAMELLSAYRWPGNIRELENVVERMVILSQDPILKLNYIPREILQGTKNESRDIIYFPKEGIDLESIEKGLIVKALELSSGNQTKAAELLKITRSALIYRMQKYDIKVEDKMEGRINEN